MAPVSYEPDSRYSDLGRDKEPSALSVEQPETYKGQYWNVDRHIRGRWAGAAASCGMMFAAWDPFDLVQRWNMDLLLFCFGCAVGGLALGFVGASIRRRFTGED